MSLQPTLNFFTYYFFLGSKIFISLTTTGESNMSCIYTGHIPSPYFIYFILACCYKGTSVWTLSTSLLGMLCADSQNKKLYLSFKWMKYILFIFQ